MAEDLIYMMRDITIEEFQQMFKYYDPTDEPKPKIESVPLIVSSNADED